MNFAKCRPAAAAVAAALLVGCAQGVGVTPSSNFSANGESSRPAPSFAQFADIPVPTGATMDVERTLLLGPSDAWIGRLVMDADHSPAAMFDFYKQRTPEFGWDEITAVRAATSVLTYTRGERVLTVQIRGRTIGGAALDITVSPRGGGAPVRGAATTVAPLAPPAGR